MTHEYELCALVGASRAQEIETIRQSIHDLVVKHGGTWSDKVWSEQRRLAYPINHETAGTYTAQRFTLTTDDDTWQNNDTIATLTRELSLMPTVLRVLIVRADELPPLLTKEERDAKRRAQQEAANNDAAGSVAIDEQLKKVLNI